jgi:hypothetical protein
MVEILLIGFLIFFVFAFFIFPVLWWVIDMLWMSRYSDNWKCRLGFHDWVITDSVEVNDDYSENFDDIEFYEKRVCLNCRLIDDKLTPFVENLDEFYHPRIEMELESFRRFRDRTQRQLKAWEIVDGD